MNRETGLVLAAVAALAALAYALWEVSEGEPVVAVCACEPVEPVAVPVHAWARLTTYDGGRTTIPPKITPAAVERIRARRAQRGQ